MRYSFLRGRDDKDDGESGSLSFLSGSLNVIQPPRGTLTVAPSNSSRNGDNNNYVNLF